METIIHEGKVYQIGKAYKLSSNEGVDWSYERLDSITDGKFIDSDGFGWELCSSMQNCAGTIEDAPLELEDGEYYMCEWNSAEGRLMSPLQWCNGGWFEHGNVPLSQTLIDCKPLYKMVKA